MRSGFLRQRNTEDLCTCQSGGDSSICTRGAGFLRRDDPWSDSHTRYGCYGTMGVGEGGPELVKQLLSNTYDIDAPEVVLVYLEGAPRHGVGPHDVAIALCGAVFKDGFVKNKILEFVGPGVQSLSMDFRIGIDVMTTETTCLSSIWGDGQYRTGLLSRGGEAGCVSCVIPGKRRLL